MKKKYVDDLSLLESINLRNSLIPSIPIIGPPNWHERPGLHLPVEQSILQHQLADLLTFKNENKMKLNFKKTKVICFNLSKTYDFLPKLFSPGTEPFEVIYETRLLGVMLASDLSWSPHVNDIVKRATAKLWTLVRFKSLGASQNQLLKVYQARIRSTLEFAAPVFSSGLSQEQSKKIEGVQKKAFALILGNNYLNYEAALLCLKQERLDVRRGKLALKFALKSVKSPRHSTIFPLNPNYRSNMRNLKPFKDI